jgi:UDP-glucuronate decarboxylase
MGAAHIFVTGGTGFFGRALLRYWATDVFGMRNARFTLLSRNPEQFRARYGALLEPLDVTLVPGDVLCLDDLPTTGRFTHVLHAAADSTTGLALKPIERYRQIVDGTQNILELARRTEVGKVLLISSGGVYGPQPAEMLAIHEDYNGIPDPLNPENAYSIAKRAMEHLAALYNHTYGIESVIARCFAFVGRDLPLDAHFAIGNFISDVLKGRDIVIKGDGTPVRSYLDQSDLAEWLSVMLMRGKPQRAYNVGSDQAITIRDLASLVARAGGSVSRVQVLGEHPKGQTANRNRYVPDVSRARTELGVEIGIRLEQAVRETMIKYAEGR